MIEESTPSALTIATVGASGLALVLIGPFLIVPLHGLKPVEKVVEGLTSSGLFGVVAVGMALGLIAALASGLTRKRMPTKVSKEEAIVGGVLGVQAVLLGALILFFVQGSRVDLFALNYLNFEVVEGSFDAFVRGGLNTIRLAAAGEFFGIILGLIMAVLVISKRPVVRAPARAFINFFRGTPLVWQLVVIGVALPLGMDFKISTYTAAIIAFSLNTAAYAAEVFRAGIQSIERGQIEAARGLGMSYLQAMRYAIVPQAIRRVIPPLMNEFVILIKDTSLVIFLGLTVAQRELMSVGNQGYENTFNGTFLIFTALGYLCVSLPAIRLVNILEKRLRSGLVGVTA